MIFALCYMAQLFYNSPVGPIIIQGNNNEITSVSFADTDIQSNQQVTPRNFPEILYTASEQLTEYFCGLRTSFDLPLASSGTEFQYTVWQQVCNIPFGQTRSYKQLADSLNLPGGSRAVGMANAKNPFLIIVPCHRTIGSSGMLTGYAGGILRKRWLLQHEAQHVAMPLFAQSI
jgi:methylated-DNA-[protein]-cysteine S-methyltransferase